MYFYKYFIYIESIKKCQKKDEKPTEIDKIEE